MRILKRITKMTGIFSLIFVTGCSGGVGSSASSPTTQPWKTYDAATPADLPTCAGGVLGSLYFVESTNQFEVCKSTGWTVIAINGTNGTNNKFAAGISCSAVISGLTGAAGTALNGLWVNYKGYVTTAGDVIADASVASASIQIGDTAFYSVTQAGAATAPVLFIDDFATANGGYWVISSNRATLVQTAVYTDSSLGVQSPVTITFASSACTTYTF